MRNVHRIDPGPIRINKIGFQEPFRYFNQSRDRGAKIAPPMPLTPRDNTWMPGSTVSRRRQPDKISFSGTTVKSRCTLVPQRLILVRRSTRADSANVTHSDTTQAWRTLEEPVHRSRPGGRCEYLDSYQEQT
ncbi:hypothetical protein GCM10009557_79580 [Virgisporangium ochraceum]|uniref:Uncharacterized protein n=1 Tax=Virgisporangium ochraceum TaxID=65505 RepID=A0A8J3ZVN6_9ACTN|nr:hypothetical protein Voc01_054180 [Virgisporangium ochraceum]